MKRPVFSRGFLCALLGIGVTILGFLDVWFWPVWPAFTALELLFGRMEWTALPYQVRGAVMVGLIVMNVAFWSAAAWLLVGFRRRIPTSARRD